MALQQRIPTVEAADVSPVQTSASPAIAALNFAASFHRDAEACRNARDRELLYENYRDKILAIDTFAANVAAAFLPFLRVAASRRDSDAGRWEDFNRLARRGKATRDRASQHLQHQSGVIAAWGLECFQHYGWQALPLPLLRQLHDLAVLMPRWDDVVNLLNSKMLARHELRVLRGKNNALRVGEHSAASKVQDSRSPVERADILAALEWARQKATSAVARKQLKKSTLVIGGSPIKKFGLKRDHYGMVVPSTISTSGSDNEQSDGDEDVDDQSDGDEDMNDQSEEDDDDISEKSDVNKDMNDQSDGDSDIDDYDISPPSPKRAKLSAAEPTRPAFRGLLVNPRALEVAVPARERRSTRAAIAASSSGSITRDRSRCDSEMSELERPEAVHAEHTRHECANDTPISRAVMTQGVMEDESPLRIGLPHRQVGTETAQRASTDDERRKVQGDATARNARIIARDGEKASMEEAAEDGCHVIQSLPEKYDMAHAAHVAHTPPPPDAAGRRHKIEYAQPQQSREEAHMDLDAASPQSQSRDTVEEGDGITSNTQTNCNLGTRRVVDDEEVVVEGESEDPAHVGEAGEEGGNHETKGNAGAVNLPVENLVDPGRASTSVDGTVGPDLSHASVSDGGSPSRTADSLPDHRIGTLPRQESEARADKTPPQPDAPPLLAPQARLSRSDGNQPIPIPIHMAAPTETQPSEAGGGNDSPPPRPPTLLQTLQQSYAADIRQLVHHLKQPHASDEVQRQRQLQLDWLHPQRWASVYAEPEHQLGGSSVASPSDADVWYLSSDSFHRYAEDGYIFRRPVVVKQQFQDSSMYDIAEYIDMLWQRFPEQQIEVQNSATGAFSLMSMKDYCLTATKVDLNSFDAITPISNATNLHRLARADEPVLSRLPRFRLLSTLADRVAGTVGRSRHLGQNDMGDHLAFNTLSFTGAHARPHVDALGGCWVRCLAGLQVWGFATNLDADDWERFQTDRCNWSPQGKGRLIVMEQDDVLFVPPGLRVIQVTFALEPCLMEGGLLWDECAIPEILDELLWNAKRPERRSEPNSFQLRAVVDALEKWFNEENCVYPSPPLAATALETGIQSLRSLGCDCPRDCHGYDDCPCILNCRPCTTWCRTQSQMTSPGLGLQNVQGQSFDCASGRWPA